MAGQAGGQVREAAAAHDHPGPPVLGALGSEHAELLLERRRAGAGCLALGDRQLGFRPERGDLALGS